MKLLQHYKCRSVNLWNGTNMTRFNSPSVYYMWALMLKVRTQRKVIGVKGLSNKWGSKYGVYVKDVWLVVVCDVKFILFE